MQLVVRILLAAVLIVADAVQASSVIAAESRAKPMAGGPASYQDREKSMLEKSERTWKRLSASICTGCGAPPQPSQAALLTSRYGVAPDPNSPKEAGLKKPEVAQPATRERSRVADERQIRSRHASARRQVRSRARLAAHVRGRTRYALRHPTRSYRRFARVWAQPVSLQPRMYRSHRRAHVTRRPYNHVVLLGSTWVSPRDRGYPLPRRSRQRHALCAYDRGFFSVLGLWPRVCVSSL